MLHKALLALCVLGVVPHRAVVVANECPLEEFADVKVLGDGTAVLHGVYTLAECNTFLVQNKDTHAAVSYDKLTGKCCGALKGTDYYLGYAEGSITFKQINDSIAPASTTRRPVVTTSVSPVVRGICDGDHYLYLNLNQIVKFSMYDQSYDVCLNFPDALPYYDQSPTCQCQIVSPDADLFLYNLSYEIGRNDHFAMFTNIQGNWESFGRKNATDSGRKSGFLYGNEMYLQFNADKFGKGRGICLTITPKIEQLTTTPSSVVRTIGVCDSPSHVNIRDHGFFTVNSNPFGVCQSFPNNSRYYDINQNCSIIVDSNQDVLGYNYYIEYALEPNADKVTLAAARDELHVYSNYSGSGGGYLVGSKVYIGFTSDSSRNNKGFCLTLIPVF